MVDPYGILKIVKERELIGMSYNGWKNRETWLVNVWYSDFGNMIAEDIEMGVYAEEVAAFAEGFPDKQNAREYTASLSYAIAERYEQWVYETIEEQLNSLQGFIRDLIDLDSIDWDELGMDIVNEYFL